MRVLTILELEDLLVAAAQVAGYECVKYDAALDCWTGYGSDDPYDRSQDDPGGYHVAASVAELQRMVRQAVKV
jgi:hypothetical protein